MTDAPIFHLSVSVSDLDATEGFYEGLLGGLVGRRTPGWFDVWLYSTQITFHEWPHLVLPAALAEGQHFGATLPMPVWEETATRLRAADAPFAAEPRLDEAKGQAKMYLRDPDGYVIELKAYVDRDATLAPPPGALA